MNSTKIHQLYHSGAKLQKRVITNTNFVYTNLVRFMETFLKEQSKILDIGCGVGTIDFFLASKGHEVIGVDISERAIKMAKLNQENLRLENKVKFLVSRIPHGLDMKEQFDLIIAFEVLEHIDDDMMVMQKIKKLLQKDGFIIISVPLENAPLYKLGALSKFDKEVGHVRRYTKDSLFRLIKNVGLKVYDYRYEEGLIRNMFFTNKFLQKFIRFLIFPISQVVTFVDYVCLRFFGPSQILVAITK